MKYAPIFAIFPLLLAACGGGDTSGSADTVKSEPTAIASDAEEYPVKTAEAPTQTPQLTTVEQGAKLYKRCQTCHTLEEGGKHRVGPNLWDIVGATAGQKEGFAYSKAMTASGVVWTDETLDAYFAKPAAFMKGNRMSFVGLKKAEDRAAVIAYLKSETTPTP